MGGAKGRVYLVGAGPGDPGLITIKAVEVLKKADVIFFDYLANFQILSHAPARAKKIYVGKKGISTSENLQEQINRKLIEDAKKGKTVVRLKGGDPFIFGRGGEEAESLKAAGIPFEVVPGITSAIAVPAYAGIPLTHRHLSSEVAFVTGHVSTTGGGIHWEAISKLDTVVFLMGTANLRENLERLVQHGKNPETPAAIIGWGTYPRQKKIIATIGTLADKVEKEKFGPPAIVVVGCVARLGKKLEWFETKPLFGKKVVVTRAAHQFWGLGSLLAGEGAEVIEVPSIEVVPPKNTRPLDQAISKIRQYDGLIFTSVNAVDFFWQRFLKSKKDLRVLAHLKIAVVGEATADRLLALNLWIDYTPRDYSARGLALLFCHKKIKFKKVLFPGALERRPEIIETLRFMKTKVDVVEAYRTVKPKFDQSKIEKIFEEDPPHWVAFCSSSAVTNFVHLLGVKKMEFLQNVKIACIGPMTRKTALNLGLQVHAMPKKATIRGLVEAIISHTLLLPPYESHPLQKNPRSLP